MALQESLHRLSTTEYLRIVQTGALEGLRVELLDGLLIDMSPQGEWHARVVQRLMRLFAGRMDLLRVQMPLAAGEGWIPEPDIALAEPDDDPTRHPSTALLAVEVAVSSQAQDRRKAMVYAQAGVPEYWLVDLPAGAVSVYTEPSEWGYGGTVQRSDADVLDAKIRGVRATTVAELVRQ